MKAVFLGLLLSLILGSAIAQNIGFGITGGLNYGGPVGKVDSAEGKPVTWFELGFAGSIRLNEKWMFRPSLMYMGTGAGYSQTYTRDTIVEIEILGVKGEIPTFYKANVNGKVMAHYVKLPLDFAFKNKNNFFAEAGPYVSYLVKGSDKGHLHLDIGEDGFLSDDRDFNYDNAFHQLEYGFGLGGGYDFSFGLGIYLKGSRSFRKLYKTSHFENQGQTEIKLYNTTVSLGVRYLLFGKQGAKEES